MLEQVETRQGLALGGEAFARMSSTGALLEFSGSLTPTSATAIDSPEPEAALRFRHYSLSLSTRVLTRDDEPVELGGRAFDLLCVLLRARGRLVERAELMRQVWPSTIVEESNLRFQIAALRRALGVDRDLIKSVTGRGYFFVAEPDQIAPDAGRAPQDPTGAQTPEDYRASCELLRELLNDVLSELRELRSQSPSVFSAMSPARRAPDF